MIYALLLIVMISTGVCYHVAKRRGLNVQLWIILGAVFGPFAVPFVYAAAPKARKRSGEKNLHE